MRVKLTSFIFRRQNVRDSNGDIIFHRIWIDRWEEERTPVEPKELILHLVANYSPELENKLLGNRRGIVDIPVDMLILRSVVSVLNGLKFVLNLTPPRKVLKEEHLESIATVLDKYQEEGFLFSIDESLLRTNREFYKRFSDFITYAFFKESIIPLDGKLSIGCSESFSPTEVDFVCEGEFEDVFVVNSLKHLQTALSKVISMISEDVSVEELADAIKGDPALVTKLLQYVNSPLFPHRKRIESITNAISYLGLENLKKFLIAVWMSQFFGRDPTFLEFVKEMIFNAFFLESFHRKLNSLPKDKLFLAGLFYKMPDAFGVRPEVFFSSIQIPEDILKLLDSEELKPFLEILDCFREGCPKETLSKLGIGEEDMSKGIEYARKNLEMFLS